MTTTTFELLEQRHVPALNAVAQVFQHQGTGARHLHLATDETEIGFLVGFPTVPQTDDGRAHILEHTVLCGSERYPVRDPFFAMMQRSVATFMNAMTFADRTVYPFSTTDPADFVNLLDVYLDATFFPRLDRMSFLQEGWRAELQDGKYRLQGVVFNEMKNTGAAAQRVLYMGIKRQLFAGTTYGFDSGGEPLCMPELSHEALCAFHASHYHPSQAVFMTSGPISPALVQQVIEGRVMKRLDGRAPRLLPGLAAPWSGPREAVVTLPSGSGAATQQHGLQLAWRFDKAATVDDKLRLAAMVQLLAGHDGAPIPQAILAMGSGRPSTLMAPDFSARQAVVHLGVEGLRADQIDSAHQVLMDVLQRLQHEGLPADTLDGVLRQLRFSQRHQVRGLQRLIAVADTALRDERLLDAIDIEPALARMTAQMREPGFLQQQVRELLACTNHLRVNVVPDEQFMALREAREQTLLASRSQALDEAARTALAVEAEALAAHQSADKPAADVLPRIRPSQLSQLQRPLMHIAPDARGVIAAELATNGLSHAEIVVDVSALAAAQAPWLALLARLLPDLGVAGKSAAQALAWREAAVQDFRIGLSSRQHADGSLQVDLRLSASALREDQASLASVLTAWLTQPDLADADHLRALVTRDLQAQLANLPGRAQEMARLAMLAPIQTLAAFEDRLAGLPSLVFCGEVRRALGNDGGFAGLQAQLVQLLQQVQKAPRHAVCAAMAPDLAGLADSMAAGLAMPGEAGQEAAAATAPLAEAATALALVVPVPVNACAVAWAVPRLDSPMAPALAVAAQLLTQQFLHAAVRERGGAYGVQARYDGRSGVFSMTSMADPRLGETYADFEKALRDVQHADIGHEALENAILSVIKGLDRPLLPLERLRQSWEAWRRASPPQEQGRLRIGVLDCSLQDVRRALATCLDAAACRRAAVVAQGTPTPALAGLEVLDLMQAARDAGCLDPVSPQT